MSSKVKGVTTVFAHWCPHCDPPALDATARIGKELRVPIRLLDIDIPEQEKEADDIVKKYGDWIEDYLIPQVFLELADGSTRHIFTGNPGVVSLTEEGFSNLLKSDWFKDLKQAVN
ncbi:MAG: thioredoxin family protein [Nitrosopumilus sp.]